MFIKVNEVVIVNGETADVKREQSERPSRRGYWWVNAKEATILVGGLPYLKNLYIHFIKKIFLAWSAKALSIKLSNTGVSSSP